MTSTGYPLYAAAFIDQTTLVVGGGGGEGRHGVKNKLSTINVATTGVDLEYELPDGEDNPTCMACAGKQLYVGANRGAEAIRNRDNPHLRVFTHKLEETRSVDALKLTDPEAYQKAIAATEELIAAVADSPGGGALQVLSSSDFKPLWSASGDFQDVAIAPEARWIAAVTSSTLTVFDAETGEVHASHPAPSKGARWARVAFTAAGSLVAGANVPKQRARIQQFAITAAGLRAVRTRSVPGKSLTCLKATENAVAVGTAAGDIFLYTKDLRSLRNFRNALKFPVTALAITDSGEWATIAGTSLDGSFVIYETSLTPFSTTVWWVLLSMIAIAILSVVGVRLIRMDLLQSMSFRSKGLTAPLAAPFESEDPHDFETLFVDVVASSDTVNVVSEARSN